MNQQMPRWQRGLIAIGKAAAYLAVFLGWQLVVSTVYSTTIAMNLMMEGGYDQIEARLYWAVMSRVSEISLVSGLLTLATVTLIFKLRRRSPLRETWIERVPRAVLGWGAGLGFCLYWLVSMVLTSLPQSWTSGYAEASASLDDTSLMAFLSTAIVAPVVEEVIFRGLIYTRLQRAMNARLAVAISAVVFGVCHGDFIWFCYAFALGLIFAQVTRYTRSILPAMVMHVVFNTTNQLLLLVADAAVGIALFLVILLLATGGTAFCAIQLRTAVLQMPRPEPSKGLEALRASARPVHAQKPAAERTEKSATVKPQDAAWDQDSGPDNRFPPSQM